MSSARLAWLSVASMALGGCIASLNGNNPREPNRQLPPSFGGASSPSASVARKKWSELFTSPDLRALVETALDNNQELNLRVQEVIIARSEVTAKRGELYPKVAVGVGVGIEKVARDTSQGRSDEANRVPEHLPDFTFGLKASWEIDAWKKLRNAAKAANLRFLSSLEARNFVLTEIVAEIARSYFELIAIDNQLDILKRNIDVQTQALEVVKVQKQAARVTELAVLRFEGEVLKNRSRLFDLEQKQIQVENRINFLVGRYPQHVRRNPEELRAPLPEMLHTGLPSELLENRPDVRRAELELEAAKLDVRVAKAAFYPSFSIDATIGYRAFDPTQIIATPASLFYGLLAGLTAPLFNWAGIVAQYRSMNARRLQSVFTYERTLLRAFNEVVNELAAIENMAKSYELQSQRVATLTRSVEISRVLFQSARADYMEVLLTTRDSLDAEIEAIETRKHQLDAMVGIYEALGGGWRDITPPEVLRRVAR